MIFKDIDKLIIIYLSRGLSQKEIAKEFSNEKIRFRSASSIEKKIHALKEKYYAKTYFQLGYILGRENEMFDQYSKMLLLMEQLYENKVSFETALLAKNAGFNEICFFHFGADGLEFPSVHQDGRRNSQWSKCMTRPTQQLLQKWISDNYRIMVYAIKDEKFVNKFRYEIVEDQKPTLSQHMFDDPVEAAEKGLQVILEKIIADKIKNANK